MDLPQLDEPVSVCPGGHPSGGEKCRLWLAGLAPRPDGNDGAARFPVTVLPGAKSGWQPGSVSKKRRANWLVYRTPCPRCGNRLVAIVALREGDPYLECVDCGLGFSEPAAIDDWVGEVFQDRTAPGGVRPATLEELSESGWVREDFH